MAPAAGLLYGPAIVAAALGHMVATPVRISTGHAPAMLADLLADQLDLVIAPQPRRFRASGVARRTMYASAPAIYARLGHPAGDAVALADVARAGWVVAGSAGTPGNVIEEAFRVRRWPPPRIAAQCADYAMLIRIIADSDLLGVISHPALVADPAALGIRPIRIIEGLPRYDVCLFWLPKRPAPAAREAVLSALRRLAGDRRATSSARSRPAC